MAEIKNLKQDLKNGIYKSVYLLFGEERFLVNHYAKEFEKINADIDTFDDKAPVQDIIMAACSLPFLSERRLVFVRDSKLFASGRKNDSEAMAEFLAKIPAEAIVVFVEKDVDRRSRMYKKTAEVGRVVDCVPIADLSRWIIMLAKNKGKLISPANVNLLTRTVGVNMNTISQELSKLAAYSGDEHEITPAHIGEVCSPTLESRIFDMTKAMGLGQTSKAVSLYNDMLRLKESPIAVLTMITRQFRILLLVKCGIAKGLNKYQIAKELNLHEFIVTDAMKQIHRFSEERLIQALESCLDTDVKIKTGLISPEIGVELIICNLY